MGRLTSSLQCVRFGSFVMIGRQLGVKEFGYVGSAKAYNYPSEARLGRRMLYRKGDERMCGKDPQQGRAAPVQRRSCAGESSCAFERNGRCLVALLDVRGGGGMPADSAAQVAP